MGSIEAVDRGLARVAWEDVPCPICAARAEETALELPWREGEPAFRLVRCRVCGQGYLNPRPDPGSIGAFYSPDYEDYHRAENCQLRPHGLRAYLERLVMAERCGVPAPPRSWTERLLARLASPWLAPSRDSFTSLHYQGEGRLLEYGCGTAWFSHRMRQHGWHATGMDFNAFAAEQARRLFGVPVMVGSLPHPEVRDASYDVITMGQVLEHVHDPHAVIGAAARALRPGGCLAIAVPNFASWGFRVFREQWWCLQLPIHLLHFTPATLRRLLESHGLRVGTLRMAQRPGWMRRSLGRLHREPAAAAPGWLRALSRSRLAATLLARWTTATGQGDCLLALAYRDSSQPLARAA